MSEIKEVYFVQERWSWGEGFVTGSVLPAHKILEMIELSRMTGDVEIVIWDISTLGEMKRVSTDIFMPTKPLNLCGDSEYYAGRE